MVANSNTMLKDSRQKSQSVVVYSQLCEQCAVNDMTACADRRGWRPCSPTDSMQHVTMWWTPRAAKMENKKLHIHTRPFHKAGCRLHTIRHLLESSTTGFLQGSSIHKMMKMMMRMRMTVVVGPVSISLFKQIQGQQKRL